MQSQKSKVKSQKVSKVTTITREKGISVKICLADKNIYPNFRPKRYMVTKAPSAPVAVMTMLFTAPPRTITNIKNKNIIKNIFFILFLLSFLLIEEPNLYNTLNKIFVKFDKLEKSTAN
jgi:hypothetical protein